MSTRTIIHVVFVASRESLLHYLAYDRGLDPIETNVRFVNTFQPDTLIDDTGHLLTILTTREIGGERQRTIVMDGVLPSNDWINSIRKQSLWKHVLKGTIMLAPDIVIPIIQNTTYGTISDHTKETRILSRRLVNLFAPVIGTSVQVSFVKMELPPTSSYNNDSNLDFLEDEYIDETQCHKDDIHLTRKTVPQDTRCVYDRLWHTHHKKIMDTRHLTILGIRHVMEASYALDSCISRNIGSLTEADKITSRSISHTIKLGCLDLVEKSILHLGGTIAK